MKCDATGFRKALATLVGIIFFPITVGVWVLLIFGTIGLMVAVAQGTVTANGLGFYVLLLVLRKPVQWITETAIEDSRGAFDKKEEYEPSPPIRQTINVQL